MTDLPSPETYEGELAYMPYRKSLERVCDMVCERTPKEGVILDLMCGPGSLIGKISKKRKDLIRLIGIDSDKRYIEYANSRNYNKAGFLAKDVLDTEESAFGQYDVVLCTGALHHIEYKDQEKVIRTMKAYLKPEGFAIISDCYIDDYNDESERRLAAAKLGYEYLVATIKNGAPNDVTKATADIIANDVLMDEYKTSVKKRLPQIEKHFDVLEFHKTWPIQRTDYGDYIHVLGRKK